MFEFSNVKAVRNTLNFDMERLFFGPTNVIVGYNKEMYKY